MEKRRLAKHDEQQGVMCKQKGHVHHARLKHQEKLDTLVLPRKHETKKKNIYIYIKCPCITRTSVGLSDLAKSIVPRNHHLPNQIVFGHLLGKTISTTHFPTYLPVHPSICTILHGVPLHVFPKDDSLF